jgi:hypothetical protein
MEIVTPGDLRRVFYSSIDPTFLKTKKLPNSRSILQKTSGKIRPFIPVKYITSEIPVQAIGLIWI